MTSEEKQLIKQISRRLEKTPIKCHKCGGYCVIIENKPHTAEARRFVKQYAVKGYAECLRCKARFILMKLD